MLKLIKNKWLYYGLFATLAGAILFIFDPTKVAFFPKCPFLVLTGWQCPGCGSQRAIHQLFHLNIAGAWHYNPLLVFSLPYVLFGLIFKLTAKPTPRSLSIHRIFFGYYASIFWLVVIVAFFILRNVL